VWVVSVHNCMQDEPKKAGPEGANAGGPAGVCAAAKGDSSGDNIPRKDVAKSDGASATPPIHSKPIDSNPSNLNNVESDVTFVDAFPTPATGRPRHSAILTNRDHLQPGDVLGGRYEIFSVLGEGGMGTVYKALDREVDHLVALKLIRSEMANGQSRCLWEMA